MADLDYYLSDIAAGDARAFGDWVARAELELRDSLRSFATAVDVEAVLQEALLRVWQVAPRVTPDGKPNALLRLAVRIARNEALSEARRLRTVHLEPEALEQALLKAINVQPTSDPLLRKRIEECLEKLPPQPSAALAQRLKDGGAEPDAVLATRVGMQPNTFLQNVTRARKLMIDCLKKSGVDLEVERS
ncbi:MAG: hypothetical protein FWD73_06425 [Polyangiaceae bacterium]|nr:hypothetical protein [Polyangiaceae bacterium]